LHRRSLLIRSLLATRCVAASWPSLRSSPFSQFFFFPPELPYLKLVVYFPRFRAGCKVSYHEFLRTRGHKQVLLSGSLQLTAGDDRYFLLKSPPFGSRSSFFFFFCLSSLFRWSLPRSRSLSVLVSVSPIYIIRP